MMIQKSMPLAFRGYIRVSQLSQRVCSCRNTELSSQADDVVSQIYFLLYISADARPGRMPVTFQEIFHEEARRSGQSCKWLTRAARLWQRSKLTVQLVRPCVSGRCYCSLGASSKHITAFWIPNHRTYTKVPTPVNAADIKATYYSLYKQPVYQRGTFPALDRHVWPAYIGR